MSKSKKVPKVHLPVMIDAALLSEHPRNAQRQSRHVFNQLKESINTDGFDESLLVVPRDDGQPGHWIVSGNHRYRAGKAGGMVEFPCVVRDDWGAVESQIQMVRRNYVRGEMDKEAFTSAVNNLVEDSSLKIDLIYERMGFEDGDEFSEYYSQEEERTTSVARSASANTQASQVKMIDDIGLILSTIFEQYGDTVPHSFLIFPAGGKAHMFVQASPTLRATLSQIAERCVHDGLDINIALGGLLQIGVSQTNFVKGPPKMAEVTEKGTSVINGPSEFELKPKDE